MTQVGEGVAVGVIAAAPALVHHSQWPRLSVEEVTFDSIDVQGDGSSYIDVPFDKRWKKGRASPAKASGSPDKFQAVLCYAAGSTIRLGAKFKVDTAPSDPSSVHVRGSAKVGSVTLEWIGVVLVSPGDSAVEVRGARSNKPLPAGVDCIDSFAVKWKMCDKDGSTWLDAGESSNPLYVVLNKPKVGLAAYWTLLEITCRPAKGKTTADDFVAASFSSFRSHTGDGRGIERMGDGVKLSYYKNGVKTEGQPKPGKPSVYDTRGILSRIDGTGRCGGWADLLLYAWALHGLHGAPDVERLWFIRGSDPNNPDMNRRFLVKNCSFIAHGTSALAPYTHTGNGQCKKQSGAPGQGKTNPQFDFGDHVVALYKGHIYDPSYGVGPYDNQAKYEQSALDGLASAQSGIINFSDVDGTPQFMSSDCCSGFFELEAANLDTWSSMAKKYGKGGVELQSHLFNRGAPAGPLKPGVIVRIPRNWDPDHAMLDGHVM